jgi:hypothetical protein
MFRWKWGFRSGVDEERPYRGAHLHQRQRGTQLWLMCPFGHERPIHNAAKSGDFSNMTTGKVRYDRLVPAAGLPAHSRYDEYPSISLRHLLDLMPRHLQQLHPSPFFERFSEGADG